MVLDIKKYIPTVVIAIIWVNLIIDPALFAHTPAEWISRFSVSFFSSLCHQQWDRLIFIGDLPLAVCARCTGIYFGFAATLLIIPFLPVNYRVYHKWMLTVFVISLCLNLIESVLDLLIGYNFALLRVILGFSFGIISAFMFMEIFNHNKKTKEAYGT